MIRDVHSFSIKFDDKNILPAIVVDFEKYFNSTCNDVSAMSEFFNKVDISNDAEESPWARFSGEHNIHPGIIRMAIILATAIARVNAARALLDDLVLEFYVTEKKELFELVRSIKTKRDLTAEEFTLLNYLHERIIRSRLAEYENI